ncbi:MAG: endo-1,4-beta-xylanase [Chloroflexi bacterium]|nr:endo-1,4-beta-xylanase [Chloroflexota bacterium]
MISRRSLLQVLAAEGAVLSGVALAACTPSEPPTLGPSALTDTGSSLRALARDRGLSLGTSVVAHWLIDRDYAALAGRHFDRVTADAAGFMSIIQPTRGATNFTNFDRVAQFAREHDQTPRLQALVWGRHTPETEDIFGGWTPTPGWVLRGDLSRDEAIAVMQQHIEKVMRRYRGRGREYVVVNEPLHGDRRRTGLHPNV